MQSSTKVYLIIGHMNQETSVVLEAFFDKEKARKVLDEYDQLIEEDLTPFDSYTMKGIEVR